MVGNPIWRSFIGQGRFFLFSISGIFFSVPGQTVLISLSIPTMCRRVGVDDMMVAIMYSVSTLLASLFLPRMGRYVDTWPVHRMVRLNALFFGSALILFAYANTLLTLWMSLFFMRLFGQGALTMTATAHTIKRFKQNRGTAIGLTQLGYPLSELVFPSLYLWLQHCMGHTTAFLLFGMAIFFLYWPLSRWGYTPPLSRHHASHSLTTSQSVWPILRRDPYFFVCIVLSSIPPIIMTAALYFQLTIFEHKSWALDHVALAIVGYAIMKCVATVLVGPIIDRFGAIPMFSGFIAIIGIATLLVSVSQSLPMAMIYYGLYGLGIGASATVMPYVWARLYGSQTIGEVKGITAIVRNGATGISPVLFSFLLFSLEWSIDAIFFGSGWVIIALSIIPWFLTIRDSRLRG